MRPSTTNRARVPEYPAHFAGWARDAAAYRENNVPRLIAYGPGARNTIDFFPGDKKRSIVVLFMAANCRRWMVLFQSPRWRG